MRRVVAVTWLLLLLTPLGQGIRKTIEPTNAIEDVDARRLEELINTEEFLAVLFYTKECKDCHKILQELEKIDDDAENFGVQFVKNGEKFLAKKYGVSEFPALVYFRNKHPAIYDGDLMKEDAVLAWLTNIESMELPDEIEEVNAKVLESLIDETEYVAVLFYKNDSVSEEVLKDLEEIDDDADKSGISFVKISDEVLALEFGLETLPALLYYRNKVPLLYDGNLHDEKLVLNWLEAHKDLDADVIEDISSNILPALIDNTTFLAVLFYDKNDEKSQTTLLELEAIDDDASKHGIPFVKISDLEVAADYGITELPELVYFEKKIPNFYQGDLSNEEEVLNWLIHQKESDEIEDVTNKVLAQMIKTSDFLAVLFYDSASNTSQTITEELERIDDDCDQHGIPLVKIDDSQLESLYGIKNPPALAFYKKQVPKFYTGDLANEEQVLQWLVEQMNVEEIEDVSSAVLQQMIKNTDFLSILFYSKNDAKSQKVIKELENIDDEADERNLPFVKIADEELAKSYGIDDELPILLYFEKQIPSLYRGDLMNEEEVLKWLVHQMASDEIEEVTDKLLLAMVKKHDQVAVLFYDATSDSHVIHELEKIDDEADQQGIVFLKTSDIAAAEKFGIEYLPALVFFYDGMPNIYPGDIKDEDEVLEWLITQLTKDEIEDVTEKMLLYLVDSSPNLAALFYDEDAAVSAVVLKELENIDDELSEQGIPFVKISDYSLAKQFGLNDELPILVYFENKIPSVYEGDLTIEADVLEWLIKQKNEDSIEEVTEEILMVLVKDRGYVLTFFAPNDCESCETILHELENIDDELDKVGILLVTTDDMNIASSKANITEFPALVLFRNMQPVPYTGDLMDENAILAWATSEDTLDIPDAIEEVNLLMLENLLNTSHSVVVLFYSKTDCPKCEAVLQSVENIDDDAEQNDVDFVKVSDPEVSEAYNITQFPTLVLFRKESADKYHGDLRKPDEILKWIIENRDRPDSFIEDVDRKELEALIEEQTIAVFFCDLMNENELLLWLIEQKTEDTMENINREMLFRLIEEQEYLAIYFYRENDKLSKDILKHLEQIDDDCSDYEVQLLKMSDNLMAKKYRVRNPPGLVFFRHGNPIVYPGDLTDEEEVLDWLTSPDNMESSDAIEKVNKRMLERVLARCDYLAVFFYRRFHCRKCARALEELENIDDDAEAQNIHFVKIDDEKLARSFGVFSVPALVFFRFGDTEDPVIYAGDLKNGTDILGWLITQKDPSSDMIEEMDGDELEELIESADFLAVLFYDPDEEDCPECQETLADLENIDDDTDRHGILFVKTTDDSIAADYGITRFPALIYFENNVPSIYEGDISAEEEVLQWLIHSKSEDTIETVNRDMCDKLIENTPYLVVLFYKHQHKVSESVLEELENIDAFTDDYGIQMVKTQDSSIARRYGVKQFPALIFFRNEHPLVYKGDLNSEEAVLDWILDDNTLELADDIEEVNGEMLEKLVERHQLLAVYFYEEECEVCLDILNDLEEIDEEASLFGIGFVKVSESTAGVQWGVHSVPTLAYFRKGVPAFYEGALSDPESVLDWLTSQDMIELKNEIEEVSRKMLDKLLQENDFIAIFFYDADCPACEEALHSLEEIDDDIDELDILFVKIKDPRYARKYGVKHLPSLTYFRKRFPTIYHGKKHHNSF
ncbi:protein disulfide-isomerase [Trichonephila inaurata madagascariensis]|uniref:Protein disulfide-isomerase n=1 Tax=Trichonephila inaurata madagascariensis TaxID=2747483 RepID=A0A8X6X8P7_9ARAC|nr:protein disulfide-isomerase [Trichonephila inaurata madagascariensis]